MLRRYSSQGLLTVRLPHRTITFGSRNCDVIIQASKIAPVHASLQYNPVTQSYWLKDHSLTAHTKVNGVTIYGQIELNNGDLVCFGDSQPLVFENATLMPAKQVTADFHNMAEERQRPGTSEKIHFPAIQQRGSANSGKKGESLASIDKPNGGLRNNRIISAKNKKTIRRTSSAEKMERGRTSSRGSSVQSPNTETSDTEPAVQILATGPELRLTGNPTRIRSVGNHLLQRVVRLQAEIARKDQEIRELRAGAGAQSYEQLSGYRSLLEQTEREKERLKEILLQSTTASGLSSHNVYSASFRRKLRTAPSIDPDQFEDTFQLFARNDQVESLARSKMTEVEVYRAFVRTMAYELQAFNDRVLRQPVRDYSDVFQAIARSLEEPFSYKLLELEADCESYLSEMGASKEELAKLQVILRDEKHHKISLLCNQLEVLLPVVHDAAAIARESIRVCSVFTQWSRQTGDEIRRHGLRPEVFLEAIDLLKEQFTNNRMARHWLPPSLTPLLRITALELKKHAETNPHCKLQIKTDGLHSEKIDPNMNLEWSPTESEGSLPAVQEAVEEPQIIQKVETLTMQNSSSSDPSHADEMEEMRKELETVTFEKNEAVIALEDAQHQLEQERNQCIEFQHEINSLNNLIAEKEIALGKLTTTITQLERENDSIRIENTRLVTELEYLRRQLDLSTDPLHQVRDKLQEISSESSLEVHDEEKHRNGLPLVITQTILEEDESRTARSDAERDVHIIESGAYKQANEDRTHSPDLEGVRRKRSLNQINAEVSREHDGKEALSENEEPIVHIPEEENPAEHVEELCVNPESESNIEESVHIEVPPLPLDSSRSNEAGLESSERHSFTAPFVAEIIENAIAKEKRISEHEQCLSPCAADCERKGSCVSIDSSATVHFEDEFDVGNHVKLDDSLHDENKEISEKPLQATPCLQPQDSESSEKTGTTVIHCSLEESQTLNDSEEHSDNFASISLENRRLPVEPNSTHEEIAHEEVVNALSPSVSSQEHFFDSDHEQITDAAEFDDLELLNAQVRELYNIKENLEERLGAWNPDLCYRSCEMTSRDVSKEMEQAEEDFKRVAAYVFELLETGHDELEPNSQELSLEQRRELRTRVIERILQHLHEMLREENNTIKPPVLSSPAQHLGMYSRGKKYNTIENGPSPTNLSDDDSVHESHSAQDLSVVANLSEHKPTQIPMQTKSISASDVRISAHLLSHQNTALGRPPRSDARFRSSKIPRRTKSNPRPAPLLQPRMKF